MIHPILKRLSHSSILLLHSCPRKYQLTKLLNRQEEENDDLTYGTAIGYGIQQLMIGRPMLNIWLEILCKWSGDIIEYDEKTIKKRKTLWHAYHALNKFDRVCKPVLLAQYEVASFNGQPAIELSFRINIGQDFYYRGFVDVVLIDRRTRELVVLEVKTTASKFVGPAKFQNSGQGLGYSIVCDFLAQKIPGILGSSYKILYLVYLTYSDDIQPMPFPKSHSQRAMWIKQLLMEVEHIVGYDREEIWPMHGESCESWNRPCTFLGVCNLSDEVLLKNADPVVKKEDFTFDISLMDLIEAQLNRHQEAIVL